MKRITSITMLLLAYGIILMHAVVPHHHHDCCGEMGIVFEDEVTCTCDHHDGAACDYRCADGQHQEGESHHPFDSCKLQDLLSQLVISSRDDKVLVPQPVQSTPTMDFAALPAFNLTWAAPESDGLIEEGLQADTCLSEGQGRDFSLRAPPAV